MKIAYCLAGHTRGFDKTISEPNRYMKSKESVDFFISTWIKTGQDITFWSGENINNIVVDMEAMFNNYKPLQWDMEGEHSYPDLVKFDINFKDTPVNVLNTLLMFKKIGSVLEYPDETYDVVVRSRFDITFLNVDFGELEDDTIYGKLSPINGLPSDIFFYGKQDVMKRSVPNEEFYTDEIINNSVNAEDVFRKYLEKENIKFVVDQNLQYVLKNVAY
jgi:hypothetical protein